MAGISRDHTDAATITPAANPDRIFWTFAFMLSFLKKKTMAAPSVVPRNGIRIPMFTIRKSDIFI